MDVLDSLKDFLRDNLSPDQLHLLRVYGLPILQLSVALLVLTAIFIPLERLFALHPKKIFRKAILTDLGYYFVSGLLPSILLSVPLAALAWVVHKAVPGGFTAAVGAWPLWVRAIASMVVLDIGSYWGHRLSHEIPLLWRFHAIHHSAEHMDFMVHTRAHPIDMVFTRLCGTIPLYILGLAGAATPTQTGESIILVLSVLYVQKMWGFFIHSNVRWRFGPLEWLVSTPAFHHWHHTNDGPDVINKNYAAMLPLVDRMFGTLYLPKDKQPERYGIDQPVSPHLLGQLIDPFIARREILPPPPVAMGAVQTAVVPLRSPEGGLDGD
jgi:sterol desaturase/sphingolipid hydroxylase (fatty acid hydroxylase superfamily)